jgi:hypothetical protein
MFDKTGHRTGGARLVAVVTLHSNKSGRQYRLSHQRDYDAVRAAMGELHRREAAHKADGLSLVPDEPLPPQGTLG